MGKRFVLAVAAVLVSGDSGGAAPDAAAPVFPIPNGACSAYPCQIDPYPRTGRDVESGLVIPIPAGAASSGLIQTQELGTPATAATVLYSAFNRDRSFLQTLWIQVMPARGGYHVILRTCRVPPATPPCK